MDFQKHCTCASENLSTMWELVSTLDQLTQRAEGIDCAQATKIMEGCTPIALRFNGLLLQVIPTLEAIGMDDPTSKSALCTQLDDVMERYKTIAGRLTSIGLRIQGELRVAQGAQLS